MLVTEVKNRLKKEEIDLLLKCVKITKVDKSNKCNFTGIQGGVEVVNSPKWSTFQQVSNTFSTNTLHFTYYTEEDHKPKRLVSD